MSDPSTAAARLQVVGMTCGLAGPLPATRRHSDRPGFDHLDRTDIGCCLTDDGAHVLCGVSAANVSFKNAGG